jgi:acetyl esterase
MLDLQLDAMLRQARAAGLPDLADLPPAPCRGLFRQILAAADVPPADVAVSVRDTGGAQPVPLRVYTPRTEGPHALVVYYHGGGYVLGDLDGYDNVCRQLCFDSGAVVVSVDYRLAPEHPFPAATDDAWTALVWAAEHARSLGADPQRIAVAGDSAGAVLATVSALRARDAGGPAVAMQALVYPPAAGGRPGPYPSRQTHAAGPTLTLRSMDYFHEHYLAGAKVAFDFRVAPLDAPSLAGLPPALVMVAAFDPLRDEGVAYADALQAAGTPATLVEYHGLAHGFINQGAIAAARLAQLQLAQALRQGLAAR